DWEFYPRKLLSPEDFKKSNIETNNFYSASGNWNNYELSGKEIEPSSYATLRATILLPSEDNYLALNIPSCDDTSYKLWVDGSCVASCGDIGVSEDKTIHKGLTNLVLLGQKKQKMDIVLQVANYDYIDGEIENKIILGREDKIFSSWKNNISLKFILFGSLLILWIYHLFYFLFRRKEIFIQYFAWLCFFVALRTILVRGEAFCDIFASINWGLLLRIQLIAYYIAFMFLVMFLKALFPQEINNRFERVIRYLAIVAIPFVFFLPVNLFPQFFIVVMFLVLVLFLYLGMTMKNAVVNKREGSFLALFGIVCLGLTGLNDILFYNNLINTGYLLELGLLVYVFSQALVIAVKSAKAFQKAEELSQKLLKVDRAKNEILSNVSREIKVPLGGLTGIADSMLEDMSPQLSVVQKNNLLLISNSGRKLIERVNDIIDFVRIESGEFKVVSTIIDIKQFLEVIISVYRLSDSSSMIKIINVDNSDYFVSMDEQYLKKILLHFLRFAVKTAKGAAVVNVSVEADKNFVKISIENVNKDKDYQEISVENSSLDLYFSTRIAEIYNGKIQSLTQDGKGHGFMIILPRCSEKVNKKEVMMTSVSINETLFLPEIICNSTEGIDKLKILVAEDNVAMLQFIVNELIQNDYQVFAVDNGNKAVEIVETEGEFDLAILDIIMLGTSGFEICKKIRSKYSRVDVPILLLVGDDYFDSVSAGMELGANDYLIKPFSKSHLLARVKNLITIKQLTKYYVRNFVILEVEKKQRLLAEKLRTVTKSVTSTLDLREVMESMLNNMSEIVYYDSATVLVEDNGSYRVIDPSGYRMMEKLEELSADEGAMFSMLNDNMTTVVGRRGKMYKYEEGNQVEGEEIFHIGIPFVFRNKLEGALILTNNKKAFNTHDISIISAFAEQAGIAIENAKLFSETERLAQYDGLTKLFNRRYFMERASIEIEREKRSPNGLSVLMLDVDHFKEVNDSYGHMAGDAVLVEIGKRLQQETREIDIVCRYGGEEFAVVMPGCSDAVNLAERIRKAMASEPVLYESIKIWFSVSIGYANLKEKMTFDNLMTRADSALYKAKGSGRNIICEYDDSMEIE
ncbi:MAG: diguanylate cyclase, partial [Eubacteriales bacterium]